MPPDAHPPHAPPDCAVRRSGPDAHGRQDRGTGLLFRFHLVDVRDLDGEALLASGYLGHNLIALLTRLGNQPDTMRRILERIAEGSVESREQAMAELLILAGLRKRVAEVREEAKKMPILNDIMDHEVIGPAIRQGRMEILLALIDKRFGKLSPRIHERLDALTYEELKAAGLRLLDAERIEDIFPDS